MKETPCWYRVLWIVGIGIFKLFFKLNIQGKEKIPKKGGLVIAANHRSYLDPIVVALVTPRKMNFMAKKELFTNPIFGYLIHKLGAFPLKRDNLDKSAYQKALRVLKEGRILTLFPEGTRSLTGKLGKLKEGPVRLAICSKVPIIPVVITGTEKALPPGRKLIRPGKIKVNVGNPILPQNFKEGKRRGGESILQSLKQQMIMLGANK